MKTEDIKLICDTLVLSDGIRIIGHKTPDGDAIGSTAGLAALLEAAGKRVQVVYPDEPADRLKFILCTRAYATPDNMDDFAPALTVALDCASASRLGSLEESAKEVALSIDHHEVCTPFAKMTFTDGNASASSEMVYFIALELVRRGVIREIDKSIAYPLYAGIASDTGNFKYSNTTPDTLRICAELLDTGIDNAEISRLLFDTRSLDKLKAESIAVQKLEFFADGLAALVAIDEDVFISTGLTRDDFDDSVNIARKIAGVEVGVYVRPDPAEHGKYKVSLRANSYANVAEIAALHGGGGHVRAAGCTLLADSIAAATEIIRKDIENNLL